MKRRLLPILLAACIMLSVACVSAYAVQAKKSFEAKETEAYYCDNETPQSVVCQFEAGNPDLPYISAESFLEMIYNGDYTTVETTDGVFTVTAPNNSQMVIDTNSDTLHFESFEDFVLTVPKDSVDPVSAYIVDSHREAVGEQVETDLDCGSYGIDFVDLDGEVYLPLYTLNDVFSATYRVGVYTDDALYFYNPFETACFDTSELIKTERTQAIADFTYNELCFVFDNIYGRPPKAKISALLKDNSFDELVHNNEEFANVKKYIKSTDMVEFTAALVSLESFFDDGGHTSLSVTLSNQIMFDSESAFYIAYEAADKEVQDIIINYIVSVMLAENPRAALDSLREEAISEDMLVKAWNSNGEASEDPRDAKAWFCIKDDMAVFSFDSFIPKLAEAFKWSLDYAQGQGCKAFLIDVSQNSGGSDEILMYMLDMIADCNSMQEVVTVNGNRTKISYDIDKNLDGVYDEKDKALHYDLDFAILTSKESFSCGNALPCMAQERGIPIIGETSGGGTCMVVMPHYPDSVSYGISDYMMLTRLDGTDLDNGAEVDYSLTSLGEDGKTDYSKMYDFAAIRSFIAEFYSEDSTEPSTEPATEATTATEEATQSVTEPETNQSTTASTPDSTSPQSATNDSAVTAANSNAVQTGESSIAIIMLLVLIIACAAVMYFTKIKKLNS